jgi:hypothetical protein
MEHTSGLSDVTCLLSVSLLCIPRRSRRMRLVADYLALIAISVVVTIVRMVLLLGV